MKTTTLTFWLQFANAFFDRESKIKIAKSLDALGVDYIELTSPASSEESRRDCEAICRLGLNVSPIRPLWPGTDTRVDADIHDLHRPKS